jgi:hypothetical protein
MNDEQIRDQRERFIRAFEELVKTTRNTHAISEKQIELFNKQIETTNRLIEVASGLIECMMMPKDGMRDVIDDLIQEIGGLRDDIRIVAKAGGLQAALRALIGPKTRR